MEELHLKVTKYIEELQKNPKFSNVGVHHFVSKDGKTQYVLVEHYHMVNYHLAHEYRNIFKEYFAIEINKDELCILLVNDRPQAYVYIRCF